jgi:hypothetical protein
MAKLTSLVCCVTANGPIWPRKVAGMIGTTKLVLICQSSKATRPVTGAVVLLV